MFLRAKRFLTSAKSRSTNVYILIPGRFVSSLRHLRWEKKGSFSNVICKFTYIRDILISTVQQRAFERSGQHTLRRVVLFLCTESIEETRTDGRVFNAKRELQIRTTRSVFLFFA